MYCPRLMSVRGTKIPERANMNPQFRATGQLSRYSDRLFTDATHDHITEIASLPTPVPQELKHEISLKGEPTRTQDDKESKERSANIQLQEVERRREKKKHPTSAHKGDPKESPHRA